jgi:hypothetical protein
MIPLLSWIRCWIYSLLSNSHAIDKPIYPVDFIGLADQGDL